MAESSPDVSIKSEILSESEDVKPSISPILSAAANLAVHAANLAVHATLNQRRSSTRSIKRRKFDDELVESSLAKAPIIKLPTTTKVEPKPEPVPIPVIPEVKTPPPLVVVPVTSEPTKKRVSKSQRRHKKPKPPPGGASKDLGRWKSQDDLALITAVQQTNDLKSVHLGIKFSCKFTLRDIQERWYALLYDPIISKLALSAMQQLPVDVTSAVQANTLYSQKEEEVLGTINSSTQPTSEQFQTLTNDHPDVFNVFRTPNALLGHWLLMKQYHLLPDQSVQPMPRGDHVLNFSDAEDMVKDEDLRDPKDSTLEHELSIADRRQKREIRHLELELPKWQVLVDSVTGISPPDFDSQTLAVLRGRLVRYLMRSREITIGRSTKDTQIDVDLSLEGPAGKISRRQGIIKLKNNGEFFIANEGTRPLYIDGKPVLNAMKQKLNNNSVVEISCLRFIFLINQDLINIIRSEAQKAGS